MPSGVLASGAEMLAAVCAASNRALFEVLWERVDECVFVEKQPVDAPVGALTFVHSVTELGDSRAAALGAGGGASSASQRGSMVGQARSPGRTTVNGQAVAYKCHIDPHANGSAAGELAEVKVTTVGVRDLDVVRELAGYKLPLKLFSANLHPHEVSLIVIQWMHTPWCKCI
jgi:hypothetical protein